MYSGIPIVNMVMFIACAMNLFTYCAFYYINFAADGKNFLKIFYFIRLRRKTPFVLAMGI